MTFRRRYRHDDRGQATVEFALVLPLLVIVLLAAVQVGLVVRDQLAVIAAARDGARAVVVADGRTSAAQAPAASRGLLAARRSVAVAQSGDLITVVVRYRSPTDLPLVGIFVPDIIVEGTATMAIEA